MPNLSPWLGALGQAFGGYAQDQDIQLKRQRQATLDKQAAQMQQAQMANLASEQQQRDQAIAASRDNLAANQRAFGTLQKLAPTHPLVANGFDPNADYLGELKSASDAQSKARQQLLEQRRNYNTLKAEFPKHTLALQPFDEANPADYGAAIADAREQRKQAIQVNTGDWIPAGVNKDGQPVIVNKNTGETKVGGGTKPAGSGGGAGGFGSGGIGGAGRTIAAINGLHNAHQGMTGYEEKVRNKTASFDGMDYWKNTVAQMYDAHGIKDKAIHATVMANLGKSNPDLANYIQNAEMWALEESSIPGSRPSDFRTKLDAFVSSLKPNASDEMINSIQRGRSSRMEGYDASVPALKAQLARIGGAGAGQPSTHTGSRAQQLWDAAVVKYGEAKVLHDFGPRPPQ
jgi:hypothetical protein